MRRHQTYRILVTTSRVHSIDLAAPNETVAVDQAVQRWTSEARSVFQRHDALDTISFAVDDTASLHLSDIANEDRARWAENALCAFSNETKSAMGQDALHDLLCDLGHYADSIGLDFKGEVQRAVDVYEAEIAEGAQS